MSFVCCPIDEEERIPHRDRHTLFLAALLSLMLHTVLSVYLSEHWGKRPAPKTEPVAVRSLQLSLGKFLNSRGAVELDRQEPVTTAKKAPEQHATKPSIPAASVDPKNPPQAASEAPSRSSLVGSMARSLQLNLTAPQVDLRTSRPSRSADASTVFDDQLLQALTKSRARSRNRVSSGAGIGGGAGSFVGGRWQSLVRIGDLCFEVIEADPLDNLSTDQWYRRDCS